MDEVAKTAQPSMKMPQNMDVAPAYDYRRYSAGERVKVLAGAPEERVYS